MPPPLRWRWNWIVGALLLAALPACGRIRIPTPLCGSRNDYDCWVWTGGDFRWRAKPTPTVCDPRPPWPPGPPECWYSPDGGCTFRPAVPLPIHCFEATPTPLPPPPPPPAGGCGLPPGDGDGTHCLKTGQAYGFDVVNAVNGAVVAQAGVDGDRIVDLDRYKAFVVGYLRERGYCAFHDPEELALKKSNDFSEQWDIIRTPASGGYYVMYGYMGTCRPAWDAIPSGGTPTSPPPPPPPPPSCVPHGWLVDCRAACDAFWTDQLERAANPGGGRSEEPHV